MMSVIAVALYIWSATVMAGYGASPGRLVVKFLDMITIAVPPALPACLTICTVFAIGRLRKKNIFVTVPDRIALAGHLDVVCFDKTGKQRKKGNLRYTCISSIHFCSLLIAHWLAGSPRRQEDNN